MSEEKAEALQSADTVIAAILANNGPDYTAARDELARVFHEDLWNGNWDSSTDLDPALGLPDLRLIQEDEYDQSMDEDDAEELKEDELCFAAGHYVFTA